MSFRFLVVVLLIGLSGCFTDEEYIPVRETLVKYKGVVTNKIQITNKHKEYIYANEQAKVNREFAGAVGELFTVFGIGLLDVTTPGQPIKYAVKLENNKNVLVYSKFNGYEIGQCVAVLVVQETKEIRMTSGSGCAEK